MILEVMLLGENKYQKNLTEEKSDFSVSRGKECQARVIRSNLNLAGG